MFWNRTRRLSVRLYNLKIIEVNFLGYVAQAPTLLKISRPDRRYPPKCTKIDPLQQLFFNCCAAASRAWEPRKGRSRPSYSQSWLFKRNNCWSSFYVPCHRQNAAPFCISHGPKETRCNSPQDHCSVTFSSLRWIKYNPHYTPPFP